MIDDIKHCAMMMGNPFGNMMRSIIILGNGDGFTTRGSRLINDGLAINGDGEFGWLIVKWETMLVENVELIKVWKFIGSWWLIWLGLNFGPPIISFVI